MFRRAKELRPLATRPAKKAKADFSVLLLDSPIAGSTPLDYLLSNAVYDSNFYCLIEGDAQDINFLSANGNVVVNLISDADNGKDLFPFMIDIADRINRPIVNDPRQIMNTDREAMSELIASIPLCKAPKTKLIKGTTLLEYATDNNLAGLSMPDWCDWLEATVVTTVTSLLTSLASSTLFPNVQSWTITYRNMPTTSHPMVFFANIG